MLYVLCAVVLSALLAYYHIVIFAFVVGLLYAVMNLGIVTYVVSHPLLTLGWASAYFLVGAGWSIAKWWFAETKRVAEVKRRFTNDRVRFGRSPKDMTLEQWLEQHKTDPRDHVTDMLFWIGFWPINAVYTLINDPFRRLCRRIYQELQGVYQRITDRVWKNAIR